MWLSHSLDPNQPLMGLNRCSCLLLKKEKHLLLICTLEALRGLSQVGVPIWVLFDKNVVNDSHCSEQLES